ncbi:MAG: hypothetical protein ACM32G_01030, partial [Betaproteobacteria bacterium]
LSAWVASPSPGANPDVCWNYTKGYTAFVIHRHSADPQHSAISPDKLLERILERSRLEVLLSRLEAGVERLTIHESSTADRDVHGHRVCRHVELGSGTVTSAIHGRRYGH